MVVTDYGLFLRVIGIRKRQSALSLYNVFDLQRGVLAWDQARVAGSQPR